MDHFLLFLAYYSISHDAFVFLQIQASVRAFQIFCISYKATKHISQQAVCWRWSRHEVPMPFSYNENSPYDTVIVDIGPLYLLSPMRYTTQRLNPGAPWALANSTIQQYYWSSLKTMLMKKFQEGSQRGKLNHPVSVKSFSKPLQYTSNFIH